MLQPEGLECIGNTLNEDLINGKVHMTKRYLLNDASEDQKIVGGKNLSCVFNVKDMIVAPFKEERIRRIITEVDQLKNKSSVDKSTVLKIVESFFQDTEIGEPENEYPAFLLNELFKDLLIVINMLSDKIESIQIVYIVNCLKRIHVFFSGSKDIESDEAKFSKNFIAFVQYMKLYKSFESELDLEELRSRNPELSSYIEPDYQGVYCGGYKSFNPFTTYQWNLADLDAFKGWENETGSLKIMISIMDSGLNLEHNDVDDEKIAGRYNFINNSNDVFDEAGHGTSMYGIIGAQPNNSIGITGLNWNSFINIYKVSNNEGFVSSYILAKGIIYCILVNEFFNEIVDRKNVVCIGAAISESCELLKYVSNITPEFDTLLVAPTGNDAQNKARFPAAYSKVLAIGATDFSNNVLQSSNGFLEADSDVKIGEWSLVAPGNQILSTFPTYPVFMKFPDGNSEGYAIVEGTSPATANAAGVASLAWSKYPHYSVGKVVELLISSARKFKPSGKVIHSIRGGKGIISMDFLSDEVSVGEKLLNHIAKAPNYNEYKTRFWLAELFFGLLWKEGKFLEFGDFLDDLNQKDIGAQEKIDLIVEWAKRELGIPNSPGEMSDMQAEFFDTGLNDFYTLQYVNLYNPQGEATDETVDCMISIMKWFAADLLNHMRKETPEESKVYKFHTYIRQNSAASAVEVQAFLRGLFPDEQKLWRMRLTGEMVISLHNIFVNENFIAVAPYIPKPVYNLSYW